MKKNIKILGTGCPKCKTLFKLVQDVVIENDLNFEIEKIEDIMKIMEFNVMTTPALVLDDKVLIKGRIPSKTEVLEVLQSSISISDNSKNNSCCS